MSTQRCIVNGTEVEVEVEDDVRLPWVLRDLLGVTGPKYGSGLSICQSCTSHINGKVFNPCAVPVGDLKPQDHITTIEGLADTLTARSSTRSSRSGSTRTSSPSAGSASPARSWLLSA
jgi:isoquinoline 1-oxidoreductase alpha subunit